MKEDVAEKLKKQVEEIENPKVIKRDENGTYLVAYDLMKSMMDHMSVKSDCKGAEMVDGSLKDAKNYRNEIGWTCSKCGETWRICVRRLRNTISDRRMREFGGYSYMRSFGDLSKILKG